VGSGSMRRGSENEERGASTAFGVREKRRGVFKYLSE